MSTASIVQLAVLAFSLGMIVGSYDAWGQEKSEFRCCLSGLCLIVANVLVAVGRSL